MAHFVGMLFANWILRVVNRYQRREEEREAAVRARQWVGGAEGAQTAIPALTSPHSANHPPCHSQVLAESMPSAPPMPAY